MKFKYIFAFVLLITLTLKCSGAEPAEHCLDAPPKGQGECDMLLNGYYYNSGTNKCEQWSDGGCDINDTGNSFIVMEDCAEDCIGKS